MKEIERKSLEISDLEEIKVKDKTGSIIATVAIPVVIGGLLLYISQNIELGLGTGGLIQDP